MSQGGKRSYIKTNLRKLTDIKLGHCSLAVLQSLKEEKLRQSIGRVFKHDDLQAQTKLKVFIDKEHYLRRLVNRLQTALLISLYRCKTHLVNELT